jgi:hypothetical protein
LKSWRKRAILMVAAWLLVDLFGIACGVGCCVHSGGGEGIRLLSMRIVVAGGGDEGKWEEEGGGVL